jgi:hypothetical protein
MTELSFHVRHEVTPDRVWGVIVAIAENFSFDHIIQSDRQLSRLRQLHLVEGNSIRLTSLGSDLYKLGMYKEPLVWDILHFLHYSQWSTEKPLENTSFWSYRRYCNLLYEQSECILNLQNMDILTADLNNAINIFFANEISNSKKGSLSLSTNSLAGIHHWLRALSPRAIENEKFSLRTFSSPELLLLAISLMIKEMQLEQSVDILITPEKRAFLEKTCLVDDNCLDRILEWTLIFYPQIITAGTRTGSYGRFIRILKMPEITDFMGETQ